MQPETVFSHAGTAAMAGWLVLILGPRGYGWLNAVPRWVIPGGLSAVYALIVLSRFAEAEGGFGSLADVASLMSNDWALLAGWIHYLAFDLFIGAVMARRMDQVGISRVVQAPILGATFMLGPIGFLIAGLTELGLRKAVLPTQRLTAEGSLHVRA
ncbi:ABA4-like family protein [Thalassobaculum sp.]|uniref:ABA4-like family protein n=1 Tax=Thalassobaculum sp. TaxID=2022740 RepID=UPI003B5A6FD6